MAVSFDFPLTNSRGLCKVVFFRGLSFPVVIVPSIMGEPMITAQPFYFLERLDSVARVRFEAGVPTPTEREIEYVIDNYLYEYSKKYTGSKMTSKISEFVYWRNDPEEHYFHYDWRLLQCLVLDTLNDPSIVDCSYRDHPSKKYVYDWCLFKPYFEEALTEYRQTLKQAMDISVCVRTKDHPSLGTGEAHLPMTKIDGTVMTLEQVEMFEVIEPQRPKKESSSYLVSRGMSSESNYYIEQECFEVSSYHDEQLLAYYFSALRDQSPVSQFKNYYNVLEYFFEDAPVALGVEARNEKQQIDSVLRWAVPRGALLAKLHSLPSQAVVSLSQARTTSSGESVSGVNLASPDIIGEYATYIYQVRNACIHSKRTRKGLATPRIAPSTAEELILADGMPIMQWLATQCIEK